MIVFNTKVLKNVKIFSDGSFVIDVLNQNYQKNGRFIFSEKDFRSFENFSKKNLSKTSRFLSVPFKYRKKFLNV